MILSASVIPAFAESDTICISNQDEYYAFLKKVWNGNTFKGKTVVLTADITAGDIFLEPNYRAVTINNYKRPGVFADLITLILVKPKLKKFFNKGD